MNQRGRQIRAQMATVKRLHPEDTETYRRLAQQFGEERIAEYIEATLKAFPPLDERGRQRLAALLSQGASSSQGVA